MKRFNQLQYLCYFQRLDFFIQGRDEKSLRCLCCLLNTVGKVLELETDKKLVGMNKVEAKKAVRNNPNCFQGSSLKCCEIIQYKKL